MQTVTKRICGKQIAFLAGGKILAIAVQIGVPVFLARYLTKTDYGVYFQFNMYEGLFAAVLNLTMASGIYYFFPRLQKCELRAVFGNAFGLFLLTALAAFLLLQHTPLGNWVMGTGTIRSLFPLVLVSAFCLMCSGVIEPLYVVSADAVTSLYYPSAIIALRLFTIIPMTLIYGGIKGVVLGILLSQTIIFLFALWYVLKHGGTGKFLNLKLLKTQLAYSLPFACSGFLGAVVSRFDKILCTTSMSAAEYAIYVIAFLGIPGVEQVYSSISDVSLTGMSQCFKENNPDGALVLLKNLEEKAISFSCPLVFGVCLYADKVIKLIYSEKYVEAVPYFRCFLFSLLFEVLASGLIVRASGKTKISMYTSIISAICTLPVIFVSIRFFGLWGGIASAMFSRLLQRILYSFYEIRIIKSTWKNYLPWKSLGIIFGVSILAFLPFAGLRYFYDSNIFVSGCLAAVYVGIVYLLEVRCGVFLISKDKIAEFTGRTPGLKNFRQYFE